MSDGNEEPETLPWNWRQTLQVVGFFLAVMVVTLAMKIYLPVLFEMLPKP